MTSKEILSHIDLTLLKPTATWEEIEKICLAAVQYNTATVCIPPSYVKKVRRSFEKLKICTVIGFPLGYNTSEVKAFEAKQAVENGTDEIDMVINQGSVKDGNFADITHEIELIKNAIGDKTLKVIVETCNLSDKEKLRVCDCVSDGGADFIKTSTGFGSAGAMLSDIEIFKENIKEGVKIKAAGGIRTAESMEAFLKAGCDRIGSSNITELESE